MHQKMDKNRCIQKKLYWQTVIPIVIDTIYLSSEQNMPITTDASAHKWNMIQSKFAIDIAWQNHPTMV